MAKLKVNGYTKATRRKSLVSEYGEYPDDSSEILKEIMENPEDDSEEESESESEGGDDVE